MCTIIEIQLYLISIHTQNNKVNGTGESIKQYLVFMDQH